MKKIGLFLIFLSFFWYGLMLLLPFFHFSIGVKGIIVSSLVILGEASFWIGGFILGKEMLAKIKSKINIFKRIKSKNIAKEDKSKEDKIYDIEEIYPDFVKDNNLEPQKI